METPRDKRDDREFSKSFTEAIYQQQKRQNENPAVSAYKEAQKNALKGIYTEAEELNAQIDFLSQEYKKYSQDAEQSVQISKQLDELKRRRRANEIRRKNTERDLIQANQESIIREANDEAIDDAMAKEIVSRTNRLTELRKKRQQTIDPDEIAELDEQIAQAEDNLNDISILDETNYASKRTGVKKSLEGIASVKHMPGWASDVAKVFTGEFQSNMGEELEKLGDSLHGPLGTLVNITGKIFDVAIAMRRSVDEWVDQAANVLAANVGRISAAMEGTGQTYQSVTENMVESLGLNRFIKQTDYISQIATLTSAGITYNVEQRALLETIKDKTIASFSSMDGNLLRLIRLKQQDLTASQFGMEAALRNTLNKVFKDSTYLRDMYDTISGAITDAVIISGKKDVTEYSSVIQTWMGAMYESGVNSNMVSKLASAINNLGSGNVSALSSDQDIQRLILLSMDTIGMDYADILQQGLSASDVSKLLNAVVDYLVKIEANTKDNNVLQASYTNLFGMTMADLQAFKTLDRKAGSLTAVNMGSALGVTAHEISKLQTDERTVIAEQIQNIFDNARFTFGSSIAKDASSYLTWKVSNLMLDVANQVVNAPIGKAPIAKTIAKTVGKAAEMVIFANELKGILSIARAMQSLSTAPSKGLSTLINGAPTYGDSTSISAAVVNTGSNFKTVNTMSTIKANSEYQTAYADYSSANWANEEEEADPILEKLEELDKLKTKNEAGQQAWAVFLTGMTDDTLRSFASIFADEDAMTETFEGDNKVLKDNLFDYLDTTSNSKATTTTPSTSTSNSTTTPTANAVPL